MMRAILVASIVAGLGGRAQAVAAQIDLVEAVRSARETHPSVAAADARIERAIQGASGVRAERLPTLSAQASVTRFAEPMVVAPLHSLDPANPPTFDDALVQSRLQLRYSLFDGGARGARIASGAAAIDGASRAAEAVEAELIEQVVAAYVEVLTARSVREAADVRVAALEAERERVERNVVEGTAARVGLLRATATLEDARARAVTAASHVGLAERSLARRTGLPLERIAGRALAPASVAPTGRGEVGVAAENPRVVEARHGITAAEARLSEERATRLPRLEASAGLLDYGTMSGDHTAEWQAGLQLSWPIFTGGLRGARIQGAEADARMAHAALEEVELRVAEAIDAAETALAEAAARRSALTEAVAQWTEVARIERLALENGSGVQSDLLRAEAGLFEATAGLARADGDVVRATVGLARARGTLNATWIERSTEDRR
jgi:outer membrane protein TolC